MWILHVSRFAELISFIPTAGLGSGMISALCFLSPMTASILRAG